MGMSRRRTKILAFIRALTALLLALGLLFCIGAPVCASDEIVFDESVLNDTMTAVLVDADSGEVLFSRKPDEEIYPASTTKIMTGLLAIEMNGGNLEGEVTVGPEVDEFSKSSSLLGLRSNATVSMRDLVYGLMLVSGNDAAAALAVHFAGSVDGFADLMNQKAAELGMTNTHFANPHGLDMSSIGLDHHSTASDMSKLAIAAYRNPLLMEVMGTPTYEITSTELNPNIRPDPVLHNGNYMLTTPVQEPQRSRYAQFRYTPTTGMKTGLLANAGGYAYYGCLVASASQDGRSLIAAIFADTSNYAQQGPAMDRWKTAVALFEYGFTGFVDVSVQSYLDAFTTAVQVAHYAANDPDDGLLEVVPAAAEDPTIALARHAAAEFEAGRLTLEPDVVLDTALTAPVTQGTQLGTLTYLLEGEEVFSVPLIASRSVYAEGDEEVTSSHYGVPNPVDFPWWMWLIIGGGAGAIILTILLLNRRRYSSRYIGRPSFGNGHYGSRRYSWNDDVPLSAVRRQSATKKNRFRRR